MITGIIKGGREYVGLTSGSGSGGGNTWFNWARELIFSKEEERESFDATKNLIYLENIKIIVILTKMGISIIPIIVQNLDI